ncbi:MAG: cadherin-like domain-containing protein [Oscillospiraceae bacterium]|nr:cadherin-like domain-containing protein [Oscillospiraceae bacterium]
MFHKRIVWLLTAAAVGLSLLCGVASAAEVESGAVYCFQTEDFFQSEDLVGICITDLPDADTGTVMLGGRVLRPGDILTADQLEKMTFSPLDTRQDAQAVMSYLPIYEDRVEKAQTVTVSIRGKEDKAPVAVDSTMETYKNLPNTGKLKVTDPEEKQLTYTVTRQPKRGTLTVAEDGSFVYTPKKNKVGVDSFTYTATDPAGNVSREATVTVTVLKPGDSAQYTDTVGSDCRFEAEWLKNNGLFVGETLGGQLCFQKEKPVSQEEFLVMMVKALGIPLDEKTDYTGYIQNVPQWLRPYVAAALRSGLTAGLPAEQAETFGGPITGGAAAVMLQNALDLAVMTVVDEGREDVPRWAAVAVTALQDSGVTVQAMETLTRGEAAKLLYQVSLLAEEAPGLKMYR